MYSLTSLPYCLTMGSLNQELVFFLARLAGEQPLGIHLSQLLSEGFQS